MNSRYNLSASDEDALDLIRKSFYIPRELDSLLRTYCEDTGLRQSIVVRKALEQYLAGKADTDGK